MDVQGNQSATRFSDEATPTGTVRAGSRALPAVLAVLVAMLASARAAEAFAPVGRTMASEAAAVRMLSEAIVRAVRTLSEDDQDKPAALPDSDHGPAGVELLAQAGLPEEGQDPDRAPGLGWHEMDRPPPLD